MSHAEDHLKMYSFCLSVCLSVPLSFSLTVTSCDNSIKCRQMSWMYVWWVVRREERKQIKKSYV